MRDARRFRWDGRFLWVEDDDGVEPIPTHDPALVAVGLVFGADVAGSIVDDVRPLFHQDPPVAFNALDVHRLAVGEIAP